MILTFYKMQALGNDFIIIDNSKDKTVFNTSQIQFLCNRRFGIGCDQLILIEEIKPSELVKMSIFNADGSEASACGNATRCVGLHLMKKYRTTSIKIKTEDRILSIYLSDNHNIVANIGVAKFAWNEIPLLNANLNPSHMIFPDLKLTAPGFAVNVGNPHIVFFVADVMTVDLKTIGPKIENHQFFPHKVNVEFAQIINANTIKMRVWERGSGITLACGTGASATFVAAVTKGLIKNQQTKIILDGGELLLSFDQNQNIILEGPAVEVFEGTIDLQI